MAKPTGQEVSQWLENSAIFHKGQLYTIPEFQPHIRAERYPSGMERFWIKVPYPFTRYELRHFDDKLAGNYDPLVMDKLPSFPNLISAACFYLFDSGHQAGQEIPPTLTFYIACRECWLDKIHLRSSPIEVKTNGTNVTGARLEIRAGMNHSETILKRRGSSTFPFPNGLPESIWLVLTRGHDWLDYREFNLTGGYLTSRKDITIETEDKALEIKGIIARGESETTEFKRQIPADSAKLTKTIAAFANGSGGIILIGVEDDGQIVGIQTDIGKENVKLAQMITNNLTTQPVYQIKTQKVDGLVLLVVLVDAGINVPYGIGHTNPKYYVRRGATTFQAKPEDIGNLIKRDSVKKDLNPFDY